MDIKSFKKTLNESLLELGFLKKGSYYYLNHQDLMCAIGIQKSNYSLGYFINVGFLIKSLNPLINTPRDVDGDIRSRFSYFNGTKKVDLFEIDKILEADLKKIIQEYFNEYIKPASSIEGLKSLLIKYPVLLYQTKLPAKKILGFVS